MTNGERPTALTGDRAEIYVAAAEKIATKRIPLSVPTRFSGEKAIQILICSKLLITILKFYYNFDIIKNK